LALYATFVFILSASPVRLFVRAFSPAVSVEAERSAESNLSRPPPRENRRWRVVGVKRSYEAELRVIGETLEAEEVSVFELTSLAEWYLIQGVRNQSALRGKKIQTLLRLSRRGSNAYSLRLSLAEINKSSQTRMAKRAQPDHLNNFRRPSNMLGTVGAYLDSKQAELFELKVRPISLTLWYRDKAGIEQQEDRAVSSFHDLFINLQRKMPATVSAD
jgi:hypothetical protein